MGCCDHGMIVSSDFENRGPYRCEYWRCQKCNHKWVSVKILNTEDITQTGHNSKANAKPKS